MRRYIKELIILLLQFFMFYVFPLFAGPTDAMGMVILILFATFLLSLMMGVVSNETIKHLYPEVSAVLFVPSVFIHYNSSALVHAVWYLVIANIGLLCGLIIKWLWCALRHSKSKK